MSHHRIAFTGHKLKRKKNRLGRAAGFTEVNHEGSLGKNRRDASDCEKIHGRSFYLFVTSEIKKNENLNTFSNPRFWSRLRAPLPPAPVNERSDVDVRGDNEESGGVRRGGSCDGGSFACVTVHQCSVTPGGPSLYVGTLPVLTPDPVWAEPKSVGAELNSTEAGPPP